MSDTTTVNDNRVDLGVTARSNGGDVQARRFAADLPRGDDRVDRVRSDVPHYATVWLADGQTVFKPPEGYDIVRVHKTGNGSVAVSLEAEVPSA